MSSNIIKQERLEELAAELGKGVRIEEELAEPLSKLMKMMIEKALNTEMDDHLGYEKHSSTGRNHKNSRKRL